MGAEDYAGFAGAVGDGGGGCPGVGECGVFDSFDGVAVDVFNHEPCRRL